MEDITKGYVIGMVVAALVSVMLMADTWVHGARPLGPLHWSVIWLLVAVLLVPSKRTRR